MPKCPLPTTPGELLERYQRGERDFSEAELDTPPYPDFANAHLDCINLSQAFVCASFRGASLRGSSFNGANIKTCDFDQADLRDADFRRAALDGATFDGAKLEGVRFTDASEQGHLFKEGELPQS